MQKSTLQDTEPDVDEEERNEFPELANSDFSCQTLLSPEDCPETSSTDLQDYDKMLKGSVKEALHKNLILELGAKFKNNESLTSTMPEDDEHDSSLELNNNGEIKLDLNSHDSEFLNTRPHNETLTHGNSLDSQSTQNYDDKMQIFRDESDWDMSGHEELMRAKKWTSLKRKLKDKITRSSFSGNYNIAHDKVSEGIGKNYSPFSSSTLSNQSPNSQWYTNEVPDTDERQKTSEATHRKPEQKCILKGHGFKHIPGAVYSCSVRFDRRKYSEDSGLDDCFMSDPLKVFDNKIHLKIQMNKRREGRGFLAVRMCSASGEAFDLSEYHHRRTLVIEVPSRGAMTFVDEPPFGEDLGHKWVDELYWRSKAVAHRLMERQEVTVRIHLIVEPLCPLMQCWETDDGVLTWKIRNWRQSLMEEKCGLRECVLSPYFYSHPRGYRLRARLFLNGAGPARGSHMSVFLDFLVGQWDDCLPGSLTQFHHLTTFAVLDQSDNERKVDLARTEVNTRGFGTGDFFYDFVALAALQEDLHIRRDTLCLRIIVKQVDIGRDSQWEAPFVAPPRPPVPSKPSRQ